MSIRYNYYHIMTVVPPFRPSSCEEQIKVVKVAEAKKHVTIS